MDYLEEYFEVGFPNKKGNIRRRTEFKTPLW